MPVCMCHVLTKDDYVEKFTIESDQEPQLDGVRVKRNTVADKKRLWELGIIPYKIKVTAGFLDLEIANDKRMLEKNGLFYKGLILADVFTIQPKKGKNGIVPKLGDNE